MAESQIPQFILDNRTKELAYAQDFQRTFHLRWRDFYDLYTGFDIVKFDEQVIKSQDGESCSEAIERQYGVDALNLIKAIM